MGIERIVIGMDFSTPAVEAARWAVQHFAPSAEVIFAHVIDVPRSPTFLKRLSPARSAWEPLAVEAAEERLRTLSAFVTSGRARIAVRIGRAHEELAALAEESGADLVLIGPHGDRPRPWKLLGTTAERLARAAAPAVLVATGMRDHSPHRILVPVDDAPITTAVLRWARMLADETGARVTMLHVLSGGAMSHLRSMAAVSPTNGSEPSDRLSAAMLSNGTSWLKALTERDLGSECADSLITIGNAGDTTLRVARDIEADLIVMGRRGSGSVIPAVLGSTVSTVLHGASCPVLVVTEEQESDGTEFEFEHDVSSFAATGERQW